MLSGDLRQGETRLLHGVVDGARSAAVSGGMARSIHAMESTR